MLETWNGKPLAEMSREELIEVIEVLAAELYPEETRLWLLARIAEMP